MGQSLFEPAVREMPGTLAPAPIRVADALVGDFRATLARFAAAGADTHLVEHAGHSPQVEQPDEFVSVLGEFIARTR
ncbi:alpha/beta fold hydrolase [Nocardia sp. IBHARD005]|uniref:alpha/beta fold hydrolase n=1 Tax=Nocardia sp. IBHARD005 TaxID=3457765 RepID=UPI004059D14A